jgi:hypothetical protein
MLFYIFQITTTIMFQNGDRSSLYDLFLKLDGHFWVPSADMSSWYFT